MNKKNIRQIGQVNGRKRVYIEDYAMTFMKQLSEKNSGQVRMAVLMGEYKREQQEESFLIYGAVEISSGGKGEGYSMDSAAWARIYSDIKQYFPDYTIMGWYLAGEGLNVEDNEWAIRFHKENFAGGDKLLFYCDPSELEENCFFHEDGRLKKQNGYCIFYERNEAMQNFLIAWNQANEAKVRGIRRHPEQKIGKGEDAESGWKTVQENAEDEAEDGNGGTGEVRRGSEPEEQVMKRIRKTLEARQTAVEGAKEDTGREKKGKQGGFSSYLTGAATAVAVLALCLLGFQYYERMKGEDGTAGSPAGTVTQNPDSGKDAQEDSLRQTNGGGVLEIETVTGGVTTKGKKEDGESGKTEVKDNKKEEDVKEESDSNKGDTEDKTEGTGKTSSAEGKKGAGEFGGTKVTDGSGREEETEGKEGKGDKTGSSDENGAGGEITDYGDSKEGGKEEVKTENTKAENTKAENTKAENTTADNVSKQPEEAKTDHSKKETGGQVSQSTGAQGAGTVSSTQSSYVVQPGDTLSGICMAQYRSLSMLDELMRVNGITDANGILAGDVLILP